MADLTIANLTAAASLTATDPVPVEQSGAAKRTTIKGIQEAAVGATISIVKIVTASGDLEITPTGNVGIGTATPDHKLHVDALTASTAVRINSTHASANWLKCTAGAVELASISRSGNDLAIQSYAAILLNPTAGNVGIGMTPTVQFELSGSIGQKASGTTWSNPSDARLKDIQGPADLQICYDDIKALQLKRYKVKDDCFTSGQITDRTVTGLVAGDVQKIIPKAVNVVPFSKVPVLDGEEEYQDDIKNENGTVEVVTKTRPKYRTDIIEDCLNLDMSQVYMQMLGTVQMLQLKVEALEAKKA